jgi:hypothetical protein
MKQYLKVSVLFYQGNLNNKFLFTITFFMLKIPMEEAVILPTVLFSCSQKILLAWSIFLVNRKLPSN